MAATRVVNARDSKYDVYIGRPSKWGNPYSHLRHAKHTCHVATREEAVRRYEAHLARRTDLVEALGELRGKVLGCWCAPLACHGDVLVGVAEMSTEELEQWRATWLT